MNILKETDILCQYKNGETFVTILKDGTKIREYEKDNPYIEFPESIDVKITNYCDMNCPYCHEQSTIKGKHADLNKLFEILNPLPGGIELAIGGGNPLSHPCLVPFLEKCKTKGFICNITVNQGHLKVYMDLLTYLIKEDLIKGIGISINNNNFKYVRQIKSLSENVVYHLIAGVNKISVINELLKLGDYCKILVLGYKIFGFGKKYFSNEVINNLLEWKKYLREYVGKVHLSFDNLAIEQLDIKSWFTKEFWETHYMGDDFTYTMYIDAVEQEYAPTSRSINRISFNNISLLDYFQKYRNKQ